MIGTIRKHSSWLWWAIAGLTIISFIWWGASPATRNGTRGGGSLGTIYGQPVTTEAFDKAKASFYIYYWYHYGEFPDRSQNVTETDIEREVYVRLMMSAKARELGIHISEEAEQARAIDLLRRLGHNGEALPLNELLERLQQEGLTPADFQEFIRDDLLLQELADTLGMSAALVPPQEAGRIYDSEHQDVSAQAVFFSGSNYLAQIAPPPGAVALFYTNYMAHYRLPDRVQLNYVVYDLTNFLAAGEQKVGETNIDAQVESYYMQRGTELAPGAKTPAEAKAVIRKLVLRQAAAMVAQDEAKQFVVQLFAMDPVQPENLVTLAKNKGLTIHTTAPFTEADGPQEFIAPAELVQTAFKLNAESPFSKPIPGTESIYVIGLANQFPSAIPPFSAIQDRVMEDYQAHEAAIKARMAGTNFYIKAAVQMGGVGKTFAQIAQASGLMSMELPPFSLSTSQLPEVEGHAELNDLKQAAFSTQPGHVSPFVPTAEGGFVLFVQSLLPVDAAEKNAALPEFISQMRNRRENEMFNMWVEGEAGRELRTTPVYDKLMGKSSSSP